MTTGPKPLDLSDEEMAHSVARGSMKTISAN